MFQVVGVKRLPTICHFLRPTQGNLPNALKNSMRTTGQDTLARAANCTKHRRSFPSAISSDSHKPDMLSVDSITNLI